MAVVVNTRSPSDSRYTLKLNINPRSPDITNNRTVVDWSLVLSFSDTLTYGRYWSGSDISYSVTINGSTVKSGKYTYDFRRYSTLTIASGSTTINHNSDGSKTISASCSAQMYTPQVVRETISGSGSLTLPTIPRASQPRLSASSVTYGSAVTIYTDRKSSAFTHRIRANWNGTTETIATSVGVSYAWTVPLKYLNRIPNAKSTTGTIYLDTYNGETLIGTKTVRLTTNAPSNIGPKIGSVNLTEAVSGIASQFGAFVQSKSRIKVTGSATGQYGASIKSYQIQINRETASGSNYTSGYLVSSGQEKVVFRATDSRGYTSTKTVVFNVLPYTPPRIDSFNAYRSDASGTVDQQGEYALARYKASITPLGDKNTKAYKIRYRPVGATSWTEIALSSDSYGPSSQRVLPNVSTESSYEIEFLVSDYFSTASTMVKISTAFVKVRFGPGNQIGIGKVPEKDGLEVALRAYFSQGIRGADGQMAINNAGNIAVLDNRTQDGPTDLGYRGVQFNFRQNNADGLNDGGIFHGVMKFQPWDDNTGSKTHELGFTDGGNLYIRHADIGGQWETWNLIPRGIQTVLKVPFRDASTTNWKEVLESVYPKLNYDQAYFLQLLPYAAQVWAFGFKATNRYGAFLAFSYTDHVTYAQMQGGTWVYKKII